MFPAVKLSRLTLAVAAASMLAACPPPAPPAARPAMPLNDSGTPAWLDEVAARCAKIASCAHAHDTPRLRDPGACIDWWIARARTPTDSVQACLASAKTCGEI